MTACSFVVFSLAAVETGADETKAKEPGQWNVGKIIKEAKGTPVWTDAEQAAAEFDGYSCMGEYTRESDAMQIVPAEGKFYASIYRGGLPSAGWDGDHIKHAWIDRDRIASHLDGWTKVDRSSSLTFQAPPPNAVVLFAGEKRGHWKFGEVVDGLLQAGARTKKSFGSFKLHVEFLTPLKPTLPLSHPGRGNSGVFAVGAYEVQVMDTFGLDPSPAAWQSTPILKKPYTWCGSIYGIRPPTINVCLPPLAWQTLDIEFTAAEFSGDMKTKDAVMTVYHNGVLVQDRVKLPSGTGGGPSGPRAEVASGPILIQKHGNAVQYRNIWIVPK
ncbi:MAG TPA: DUF1080 domain-containing protein [Planctomycetaceae bacterium]|nr:DUF1080 domain-containing protein [Planctomycetaceae bacterium]